MVFDPFLNFFESTGTTLVQFAICWAIASIVLDILCLLLLNKKNSLNEYLKLFWETWMWPISVLIPSMFLYLWLSQIPKEFETELTALGFTYSELNLDWFLNWPVFFFLLGLAIWINIIVGRNAIRAKTDFWILDPPSINVHKWELKWPIVWFRVGLIGFPMTLALLLSFVRFIDIWIVLYRFLNSGWLPEDFILLDSMYGASWAYRYFYTVYGILLIGLFGVGVVFTISRFAQSLKSHIAAFVVILLVLGSFQLSISLSFDNFFSTIHDHFFASLSALLISYKSNPTDNVLPLIEANYRLNLLAGYSSKFEFPNWLSWVGDIAFIASLLVGALGVYNFRAQQNAHLPPLNRLFQILVGHQPNQPKDGEKTT